MSGMRKAILIILGLLSAVLLIGQLVMGVLISRGRGDLIEGHRHSGYTTVALCLVYIVVSLVMIVMLPGRAESSDKSP
jgi:hypothetical protein